MFVVSAPGICWTTMFESFLRTSTALNGTWSTQSTWPDFMSAIIESAFV